MADNFYMCLVYNNFQRDAISHPTFFKNIFKARVFAFKHAKLHFFDNIYFLNKVRIFKFKYGQDSIVHDDHTIEFWDSYVEGYNCPEIDAISVIKNYYIRYFKRKMDAIYFLQYALKKAISNPKTELCKRRLLEEYNEMN